MYQPLQFREDRLEVQHGLMRANPLAALVVVRNGEPAADHLPLLLDAAAGAFGTLLGHAARANALAGMDGAAAMAIFAGPQAYVSPSFYPSKAEHGRVVPTWNYAVVHAWGRLRIETDAGWLRAHVGRLTETHEAGRAAPWAVDDAPEPFVVGQLRGIVGVVLAIERIEGKWKMSQNRSAADRAGVVTGLVGNEAGDVVAELM